MYEDFKWEYDATARTLKIKSAQMPDFLLQAVERNGAVESIGPEEIRAVLPWSNAVEEIEVVDAPNLVHVTPAAFAWLPNLVVANISSALVIGNSAFYSCPKIRTVLMENVQVIGNSAFARCLSLERTSAEGRSWLELRKCRHVSAYAFQGCSAITTVTFKKKGERVGDDGHIIQEAGTHLEFIGEYAFMGCSGLKKISLGGKDSSATIASNALPEALFPKI